MENWHYDFPEFIDWKHNAGDDYLRMRTANTAVWLSDEFMKRVEAGDDWYMFDPKETPDLNELYGQEFSRRYAEYIEMAKTGRLRMWKKVPATEQWHQILVALQSTSHPWLTWKDAVNLRALNNNTGTIHMSNLCTEICLPQDKQNVAVCNLISLNLAAHIEHKQISWNRLEDSVRCAVRQLDNLIDINQLPIPEAAKSDKENRAIGVGIMGFADALEQLGMPYESGHAAEFADRVFEFVSYMAIDESANLARERGSYAHFAGSRWAQGMVPVDTLAVVEAERGFASGLKKDSRNKQLNWDALREKVKGGMRNATLMAIAPNANIGLVAGTTPGIDPRFAQVFSRNKISGKYMDINHNLVKDLKNMGLWDEVREQIVEQQGDIGAIPQIPTYLKQIYKTSFTTSPYAFIEIAARAQKWVDQALSRNIYLENRDMDEMKQVYISAWKRGLKTTYYLHMKPRHTAEQSTTNVNKGAQFVKRGFAGVVAAPVTEASVISPIQQSPVTVQEVTPLSPQSAPSIEVVMPVETSKGFATVAAQGALPTMAPTQAVLPVQEVSVRSITASIAAPASAGQRMGFATVTAAPVATMPTIPATPVAAAKNEKPFVCPIDPAERAQCDSCQ
jgi:ribonucleoside-diphosphate reductase alpha chain